MSGQGRHTAGPWVVKDIGMSRKNITAHIGKFDEQGKPMNIDVSPQIAEANARLIAAAPDMVALLKELIAIEGPQPGTAEWARKVEAMIARAEGRAEPNAD